MIKRSFKYLSKNSFLLLYRTYIRPHLEYCAPIWSPYLAKDIDALEQVQHCATKLVKSLCTLPYEDRLISLQLQSLYCRRQRGDLIETFKILHNFANVDLGAAFTFNTGQPTRGHPFKLMKSRCNLELRKHFFTNRVINQWNSYPVMLYVHHLSTPSNLNLTIIGIRLDMDKIKGLWPINCNNYTCPLP